MDTLSKDLSLRLKYREAPVDAATTQKNRQAVMHAMDEVKAGNFNALWDLFDDNVVFHEAPCLPYGGSFKGKEAAIKAYTNLSGHYSNMRTEVDAILGGEDVVIIYQTINFTVKANGNEGTLPVSELFRFKNGKVVEWRAMYFDANMVMQKLTGK
jgi:hypothetical protein